MTKAEAKAKAHGAARDVSGLPTRRMLTRTSFRAVSSSAWLSRGALAMNPDIMLFDEPTSALDPEMVGEVLGGHEGTGARRA